jgi:4-amino-4-deoxy-L-arabinose transferase-like glycosyltransferase
LNKATFNRKALAAKLEIVIPWILIAGAITRVAIFFQNRSFFLDEANLARNVVEKSLSGFFKPLDYEQYAPPFFMVVQKINTWWLGANEYALRLFPLLAGIFSLYLLFLIAKKLIRPGFAMLFVFFIFAFSEYYLHYGTEGKQYAVDVMVTLLLLNEALKKNDGLGSSNYWKWTIGGILVIWVSMPSVFMLAGVGIYFLVQQWKGKLNRSIWSIAAMIMMWLVSFTVYYFWILRTDVESDYLQNYHEPYFLPLFPTSAEDFHQIGDIFQSVLSTTFGHTVIALLTGLTGLLTGLWTMYKSDKTRLILMLVPVLAVMGAAAFRQYSLIPRLTLFFIPILLLLTGVGFQWIFDLKKRWLGLLVFILMIGTLAVHDGIKYLWKSYEIEEIRLVLDVIAEECAADDLLYVTHSAKPAFFFYIGLHENRDNYQFSHYITGDWRLNPNPDNFLVTMSRLIGCGSFTVT